MITVSFSIGGRLTKQRLTVPAIEIRPVRLAKIVHFIYPSIQSGAPFSIASSIMNIGYSTLENVKVHSFEMILSNPNGEMVPYTLEGVQINKNSIGNQIYYQMIIL